MNPTTTNAHREEHAQDVNGSFAATGSIPAVSRKNLREEGTFSARLDVDPGKTARRAREEAT